MENPIETCRRHLESRDFVLVRFIIDMQRLVHKDDRSEYYQIKAICDVLIAAKNRLPNGSMDYYKILKVTRPEPVVLEDFKKLMKLLDEKENHFPCSQEAAQTALQAWSCLSKPHLKKNYDRMLMLHETKKKKTTTMDCIKGRWKPSEDLKLRELVTDLGPQNWKCIAEKIQGRTVSSCRLRWFNELSPMINKSDFSNEEDEKLLAAQREFGSKWSLIAKLFNGRTDNAVKNRWRTLNRKLKKQSSEAENMVVETTGPQGL